jgi:hypothetical protein
MSEDAGHPWLADVDLPRHLAVRAVGLLLVVAVLYSIRPLFHGLVYQALYSPSGLLTVGITTLAALVLWFLPPFAAAPVSGFSGDLSAALPESANQKLGVLVVVFTALLIVSFIYGIPAGMVTERTMAQDTMSEATEIQELPQVNPDNPRIAPRAVSDVQTRGSVSYRTHRLGPSDIARAEDGSLAWSYAIEPNGFRNKLLDNQRGVLLSDMTRMEDRQITAFDEQDFAVGEGMFLHRSSDWNLRMTDYFSQYYDDAVEFTHDGEAYMYYPKTGHEWRLTPIPHTVPTWDGGALLRTDGTIEHLTPEEAQNSEILDGQRLYPLYNSRQFIESLGYRNGIVNQLPTIGAHRGEVEIASLPAGTGNSQPFVVDLEGEQMNYVTTMEPYGSDTRGLDEVWLIDAATGEFRFFGSDRETLTGPERAMGIVRSADSQTGWGDNFQVVEPVPVFLNDQLWWHSKVVPIDNTDISRSVFVSASTEEAVELGDTEAVREFIATGDTEEVEGVDTEPAPNETGVDYYIVISDADGSVIERIPVEPTQEPSISYEPANATG